jgi:hypothetical protein
MRELETVREPERQRTEDELKRQTRKEEERQTVPVALWAEGSRKQDSLQDPDTKGHLLITAGPITKLCAGPRPASRQDM